MSDLEQPEAESPAAYFRLIEETFVRLRGAPLLLSPADWQVARRWHEDGVPLSLVRQALTEVFARRAERGVGGRIQSLRFCAPAVEAAWARERELLAGGEREERRERLDPKSRLQALAEALPTALSGRGEWQQRIRALASTDVEAVEERLAAIGEEILDAAASELSTEDRREIAAAAEQRLQKAARGRPPGAGKEILDRLYRQGLRRHLELPVLSLFSPEAYGADE